MLFWVLVLLVVGLALFFGLILYIPGLLLSKLTKRQWFETPGASLIGCGLSLLLAAHDVQDEMNRRGKHATTTIDEQE